MPDHVVTAADLTRQRRSLGLTQEAVAQLSGLTRSAVSRVETGMSGVGSRSYEALLTALDGEAT